MQLHMLHQHEFCMLNGKTKKEPSTEAYQNTNVKLYVVVVLQNKMNE